MRRPGTGFPGNGSGVLIGVYGGGIWRGSFDRAVTRQERAKSLTAAGASALVAGKLMVTVRVVPVLLVTLAPV